MRPEHVEIAAGGAWPLRVQMLEMLGAERLVYGQIGELPFTLRIDGTLTPPRPGDTIPLQVAAGAPALVRRRQRRAGGLMDAHAWPLPLWIAHRGAGRRAPENTLAAFRLGAAHGYRAFECDVKLSADGVPFLLHDSTLERTTNGRGVAGERPWAELSRLDAGGWHSRAYAGEPMPSLDAIARYVQRNDFALNVEIKPTPETEHETGLAVGRACGAALAGLGRPAAVQLVPPRGLARRARERARDPARAARRHAVAGLVRHRALARLRRGGHQLQPDGRRARRPTARRRTARAVLHGERSVRSRASSSAWASTASITDAVDRFSPSGAGVFD